MSAGWPVRLNQTVKGEKLKTRRNQNDDYSERTIAPALERDIADDPPKEPYVSTIGADGKVSWNLVDINQKVKRWAVRSYHVTDGWSDLRIFNKNKTDMMVDPAKITVVVVSVIDSHNQAGPFGVSPP